MIYTVTFSPSLDYVMTAEDLNCRGLTRAKSANFFFGGKGINSAVILNELCRHVKAIAFLGGFTGDELVRSAGIPIDAIPIPNGRTRVNVKLRTENGETEINAPGCPVGENGMKLLRGQT